MSIDDTMRTLIDQAGYQPVDMEIEELVKQRLENIAPEPLVGILGIHETIVKPKDDEAFRLFADEVESD